jgi:hypothetical protein
MNMETHNRYFRDVNYNTDKSVKWDVKTGSFLSSSITYLPEGIPNYMTGDQSCTYPFVYDRRIKFNCQKRFTVHILNILRLILLLFCSCRWC